VKGELEEEILLFPPRDRRGDPRNLCQADKPDPPWSVPNLTELCYVATLHSDGRRSSICSNGIGLPYLFTLLAMFLHLTPTSQVQATVPDRKPGSVESQDSPGILNELMSESASPSPETVRPSAILHLGRQKQTAYDVGPPPDGGLVAWTQVLMSHLINFNAFGYMLSFGIFQGYYTDAAGYSPSDVSWVGTIGLFLAYFISGFSGHALDAGHYRTILVCGLTLQLIGVFTTSVSTAYWQLFLSQGICSGIGNGLLFCPAVALVSTYFSRRRRAAAVSLVACGGGTGGMVFPAIAQSLLPKIGFAWTVRAMGFVMLFNAVFVLLFSRTRLPPRKSGPLIDWDSLRESSYVSFCVGVFFVFWGLFFAYYYIRPFSRGTLHASDYASFNLLLILNGMGVPGRFMPALLSDRCLGPLNTIIPLAISCGVLTYFWVAVRSVTGLYAWDAVYGFLGGGVQSLVLAASSSFTPDLEKNGGRMGIVLTIASFGCLSGPPIGGRIIQHRDGDYLLAQVFAGTAIVFGSLLLLYARLSQTGLHLRRRV
jgi:MFS family permease